jgi:hypothetical protein
MKAEVNNAIIEGIVTITVTILTVFLGYLNSGNPGSVSSTLAATVSTTRHFTSADHAPISVQRNHSALFTIDGDCKINIEKNISIQGEKV